jgi:uncharacterized protein (TIGR00375 family)
MKFTADLHIHSHFSRATSPQLNLPHLHKWAQLKGLTVIGTGDFVHPGWLQELKNQLEPAEPGLFRLKEEFARSTQAEVPARCRAEVRFMLTVEISSIYKRGGKVRKVHNIIFAPSFAAAEKLQARLEAIGNIRSDGRPILGLDSRDLLEIALETDPLAFLIPAHIWTPWFSALGSKGGFDSIDECFADLTLEIFAVETGLSSDPPMNWRLNNLDRFVLVSNSDAHSPQKLAREANVFDTELSYPAIYRALKEKDDPGLIATLEFFPEEGKYHYDGHRVCKSRLHPRETMANNGLCPVCGKEVTVGVMARVEELADRQEGEKSARGRPYCNLIPLPEIIAEAKAQGVSSKSVMAVFDAMLAALGNELYILQDAPLADIERAAGSIVAEGIRRMRAGEVKIAAGYDGEYGTIKLFSQDDRKEIARQTNFFQPAEPPAFVETVTENLLSEKPLRVMDKKTDDSQAKRGGISSARKITSGSLSASQAAAVHHRGGHLLIIAGPGSGKTHTLAHRIAHLAKDSETNGELLCITFTNKAAEELRQRLEALLGTTAVNAFTGTFHSFCLHLLRQNAKALSLSPDFTIITESEKEELAGLLWPQLTEAERGTLLEKISLLKSGSELPRDDSSTVEARRELDAAMREQHKLDFDDLLLEAIRLMENFPAMRDEIQKRHHLIFVDEYQDINAAQHTLLKLLVGKDTMLTAIGDPNQSIYGFRGSRPEFFNSFADDFPGATILRLQENYRSASSLLSAAGQVIAAAPSHFALPLSPTLLTKGRLVMHGAPTANAEAEYVVHQIEKLVGGTSMFSQDSGRVAHEQKGEHSFGDIAILYRISALRPALEEALDRAGMPYQISGETPLIDKPGIRPLVTALRMAGGLSPAAEDVAQLMRFAVKGFGQGAYTQLTRALQDEAEVAIESLQVLAQESLSSRKHRQDVADFCQSLNHTELVLAEKGVAAAIELLMISYFVDKDNAGKAGDLFHRVLYLARRHDTLQNFFDALLLQRDHDEFEYHSEKISLLTLHAAKGLEFEVVFIIGCEETLMPLSLPGFAVDADEERRLFYVGMTRAQEQLYLLRASRRSLFGKSYENPASPFLADIEEQLKEYEAWQAPAKKAAAKASEAQLSLFDE